MTTHDFALFDAFSQHPFGGSRAGLVADAGALTAGQMQAAAIEIGAPATAFITHLETNHVDVRFFSTLSEYPMCGHATLGLLTWLVERGDIRVRAKTARVNLSTPAASSVVDICRRLDDRIEVMLNLRPATLEAANVEWSEISELFATALSDRATSPLAISRSEFNHLIVPLANLEVMASLTPNFSAIAEFSRYLGVDTVVLFCLDTVHADSTVHCREFCPAVGTDEAPAAGTTNRALAGYLFAHGLLTGEQHVVIAEQGFEMGRPSKVRTELSFRDGQLTALRVGGIATKTIEGQIVCA